jgi:uncharacterized protein YcaQ
MTSAQEKLMTIEEALSQLEDTACEPEDFEAIDTIKNELEFAKRRLEFLHIQSEHMTTERNTFQRVLGLLAKTYGIKRVSKTLLDQHQTRACLMLDPETGDILIR